MSKSNTRSFITRLFVFVVSLALVGADLFVSSAQNANSSTTSQNDNMSMQNTNMSGRNMNSGGRRRRRGRRGRRRSSGNSMGMSNANAACGPENTNMAGEMQENANTGEATTTPTMGGGRRRRRGRRRGANMNTSDTTTTNTADTGSMNMAPTPVRTGRCDPNVQEQTDLSGTYTGTINYTEGNMTGDATLTITGNDFTLTSGSTTQEGRVVAVTTCNYTAVTMRLGKEAGALPTLSLRAKRMGSGLSLMSVSGESKQFSFTSAGRGGGGGGRRRGRRGPIKVGIKPPTVASGNAK